MADVRPAPQAPPLPTLTEVVFEVPAAVPEPAPPAVDESRIADAVMSSLQPRVDMLFEYRLREALAPLLARAAETIVAEARDELARTLRDVVNRAVSQELARRRTR